MAGGRLMDLLEGHVVTFRPSGNGFNVCKLWVKLWQRVGRKGM